MTALQPQALIGQWLPGGYRIRRFVGAGAFAWVYQATNFSNEKVAIKVLQNATPEATTMFAREIKVLRALPPSDHCVRYLDDGVTEEGMLFLAMEFIDGCTLKDAFKFKPQWQVEEACNLMLQLCEALSGLHRLGVAHRDLKPENVMLTRDWQVKLMDFGLVKDAQGLLKLFESEDILTGRDFAENIDRAMLAGTPEYMAPEQFSDPLVEDESKAKTDTWSDVYTLALIFYQLLVGRKLFPFEPDNSSQSAYARSLLAYIKQRSSFQDSQLIRPNGIPNALWPVLACALRQNPKHRYPTASEFAEGIQRYLATGESDNEFDSAEETSIADMGSLLATLQAASAAYEVASKGGKRAGSVPPPKTESAHRAEAAPPIDVAAVQAYRDKRLNAPGRPDYTLPPGALMVKDVFPTSIVPAPPAEQNVAALALAPGTTESVSSPATPAAPIAPSHTASAPVAEPRAASASAPEPTQRMKRVWFVAATVFAVIATAGAVMMFVLGR